MSGESIACAPRQAHPCSSSSRLSTHLTLRATQAPEPHPHPAPYHPFHPHVSSRTSIKTHPTPHHGPNKTRAHLWL